MTDKLKQKLALINGNDEKSTEQMIQILALPDSIFDEIFPEVKKSIPTLFKNEQFQSDTLKLIRQNPFFNLEQEKKELRELIQGLDEEDELSANKKELISLIAEAMFDVATDIVNNPREHVGVKIKLLNEKAKIPQYAHPSDAGADVFLCEDLSIPPHKTALVPLGFKIAIPAGYEIQVRPRSGLSLKTPLRIANTPGTIDCNYRGEVGIILENTGNLTQKLQAGDKIAQLVIAPTPMIDWETVDELDETDRGENGYGSTDKS